METVTTDQGTFEYVGEFHYEDGTVHRYRRKKKKKSSWV